MERSDKRRGPRLNGISTHPRGKALGNEPDAAIIPGMTNQKMDKVVVLARGLGTRMRRNDAAAQVDGRQAAVAEAGIKAMIPIDRPVSRLRAVGRRRRRLSPRRVW